MVQKCNITARQQSHICRLVQAPAMSVQRPHVLELFSASYFMASANITYLNVHSTFRHLKESCYHTMYLVNGFLNKKDPYDSTDVKSD